ncbi:anti-sigma factor antagonist [Ruminococcus sp. NK3A76]|uniref:STAS domain-containing protein n=1 Tax=Ruminococcus sp. NK3A76 TaxID=877411 RepID=UPI00068A10AF|nr:anti-sigma factor antagonist [Ruminococcus sp. NK3A76]
MLPTIDYCAHGRILSVFLSGELDHHNARPIREHTDIAIEKYRPALLVLDFSKVTFMDSSGIGLIMGRFKRMTELGSDILIANPSPAIRKLIGLASVERVVRVVYTAHSASVSN